MDGIIVLMMPSIPFGLSFWPYLGGATRDRPLPKRSRKPDRLLPQSGTGWRCTALAFS